MLPKLRARWLNLLEPKWKISQLKFVAFSVNFGSVICSYFCSVDSKFRIIPAIMWLFVHHVPLCCGLAIWKRRGKNITPEVPVIILRFPLIILGSRWPDQVAERYGSMWGSPFGFVFGWAREKKRALEEEERAKGRGEDRRESREAREQCWG